MDIWTLCDGLAHITTITDDFLRIVESQQQIATSRIVDDLDEQALLESLLENSKPPLSADTRHLHYLLATPFRYPPLKHGSRFGQQHERSLFYGSKSIETLLAEASYYRFVFWSGMATPPKSGQFITEHTVFAARYYTASGVLLHQPPFNQYATDISNPAAYAIPQQLGASMRGAGVQALEYVSARDVKNGINIALYSPDALSVNEPLFAEQWICRTSADIVRYATRKANEVFSYSIQQFYVDGSLPEPAI